MARTGAFGGFAFDSEVFADYMAELPTWSNAILLSGILAEDPTIMDLIGERGNVATLPFYKPLDIADHTPLNNDGNTDNTPEEISGGKQTTMLIQRMKAFKAKDFTRELTGAEPLTHVANSINDYYMQVWEAELMNIVDTVMKLSSVSDHVTDISSTTSTVAASNKIDETSMIYAEQKAFGDTAGRENGLIVMHSAILARYKAMKLVDYMKYTDPEGITRDLNIPTIGGRVVVVSDRHTVVSGATPKYKTTLIGAGAILTAPKTNYVRPYYADYDGKTSGGVETLFTKQGRVLHPNGFSLKVANIADESPLKTELATTTNWELAFNAKNVRIGQIISNG